MIEMGKEDYRSTLVIVAALNEEEGIGRTILELRRHLANAPILVVDGRSRDKTVDIARNLDARVITQEGKGKGDAVAAAIKNGEGDIDFAVFTDADYTYPAQYVPEMIKILEENPSIGMVCGNRFSGYFEPKAMKNMFYIGNRLLAFGHNMLNGIAMRDPLTGLRVIRWNILRDWKPRSAGFDIEVELNHHVERCGYDIVEINIPYRERLGEKKLRMKHGFTIMKRILSESAY